tara:strand:+ start:291 stop:764 length:474 start_codon:yes stop_codon:yes gene_type:complete
MNKKSLLEREITKAFIMSLNPEMDLHFRPTPKKINSHEKIEDQGKSDFEIKFDKNGMISRDDLYRHFDLNKDNEVSKEEYVDHIKYHCENPETLDHYKEEEISNDVPCNNSYQRTTEYFSKNENEFLALLEDICRGVEGSCKVSCCQAIMDLIKKEK